MANQTQRPVTGLECKSYYNAGTYASPTWTELTRAINVSYGITKDEADQRSRSSGWAKAKGVHKALEITITYRKKQGTDTVFDFLQAACLAGTAVEFAILDGSSSSSGVQGVRAYCEIFGLEDTQDLASTEEVQFTIKPTYYEDSGTERDPEWYEIS